MRGEVNNSAGHLPGTQRAEIFAKKLALAAFRLWLTGLKAGFDPNQPRVPIGLPDGGQWTDGDGPFGRPPLDLHEEEFRGGHTLAVHVGKTPAWLKTRILRSIRRGLILSGGLKRAGSFPSVEAANKLVRATLARNPATVKQVASGKVISAFVKAQFGSKTGIEAWVPGNQRSPTFFSRPKAIRPIVRDTQGVGVFIVHDPESPRGYTVITAYPRND